MECVTTIKGREGPVARVIEFPHCHARGYTEGHRTITRVRLDILGLISTERMRVTVTRAAPLPTTQKKGAGQSLIRDDVTVQSKLVVA